MSAITPASPFLPSVAVIVPIYNVADYLAKCIRSILAQTYRHFTLIAVDDGSTDGSGEIAEPLSQEDARIVVLHQVNGGLSAARNTGLNWVRENSIPYEFISFVDGDDIVEPNFLLHLLNAANRNCADITVCSYYKFTDDGRKFFKPSHPEQVLSKEDFLKLTFSQTPWNQTCGGGMVWKCLYRRHLLNHLDFPHDRELLEDEIFNTQAAALMTRAAYIPDALYGYRIRSNSLVQDSRFAIRRIDCRQLCIAAARGISPSAYLITCAAYTASVLAYYKTFPQALQASPVVFSLPETDIRNSFKAGFLSSKHFRSYQLMQHPWAFRFFLSGRTLAHHLRLFLRQLRHR